ncbi:hypothetical protein WDV76_17015 [Xenorhabdus griffiniae]|uniref:hypothetical protein n=1 Tax=Xenorhabdus griffiniae TaxID=351672 RepID=UPI0030CF8D9C
MNRTNLYKAMLLIFFTPVVLHAEPIIETSPGICEHKDGYIVPCKDKTPSGSSEPSRDAVYSVSYDDPNWPRATDVNGNIGDAYLNQGDQGIALGSFAYALLGSAAVGGKANSYAKHGVVVGGNSQVDVGATNSVAVGYQAYVTGKNSIALGSNSIADKDNIVSIGSNGNHKGVDGDIKILRKLVNLDDGDISANSKEAINGSQLQTVKDAIENNKNLLDMTNQTAEENTTNIIDLITRVGVLEKKCNR